MIASYNRWTRIFGFEEIWYDAKTNNLSADCEVSREELAKKETVFNVIKCIIGYKILSRLHAKIAWYPIKTGLKWG